jgi:predicted nucleic-acid-binding protein
MASLFVDTNVFLRFLTNDDPAKAKRAETLFRDALRGKIRLATSLLVIAEIIWTLESFYKLEKPDIAAKIEKILNTPILDCDEAPLLFMALDLYVHANIDFVDAYNAFHMKEQGLTEILTYDRKHFARVPWAQIGDLWSHGSGVFEVEQNLSSASSSLSRSSVASTSWIR